MKNRFYQKILLRKMLTRTFRYKVTPALRCAAGRGAAIAAIDSHWVPVARDVTSAKWLSALPSKCKKGYNFGKNNIKKIAATDDSSERWWNSGWHWLYFHQLCTQSHSVSGCPGCPAATHSQLNPFATLSHWLCYMTMKICIAFVWLLSTAL